MKFYLFYRICLAYRILPERRYFIFKFILIKSFSFFRFWIDEANFNQKEYHMWYSISYFTRKQVFFSFFFSFSFSFLSFAFPRISIKEKFFDFSSLPIFSVENNFLIYFFRFKRLFLFYFFLFVVFPFFFLALCRFVFRGSWFFFIFALSFFLFHSIFLIYARSYFRLKLISFVKIFSKTKTDNENTNLLILRELFLTQVQGDWLINWLILTPCQLVWNYFMPSC